MSASPPKPKATGGCNFDVIVFPLCVARTEVKKTAEVCPNDEEKLSLGLEPFRFSGLSTSFILRVFSKDRWRQRGNKIPPAEPAALGVGVEPAEPTKPFCFQTFSRSFCIIIVIHDIER